MAEPENGSSPLAEALARGRRPVDAAGAEALPGGPRRFSYLLGLIPGIAPASTKAWNRRRSGTGPRQRYRCGQCRRP